MTDKIIPKDRYQQIIEKFDESPSYMAEEICRLDRDIERYKTIIRQLVQDGDAAFICGGGGKKDQMGLQDFIFVCPTAGLDGFAVYTKIKDYSAPGW